MKIIASPSATKETIKRFNIRMNKKLGQNFLIDRDIVNTIIDKSDIKESDVVLEIGPGIGSMTTELVKRAGYVGAVEIDRQLIPALENNLAEEDNVSVIHGDILKIDVKQLIEELKDKYGQFKKVETEGINVKVVANLPYYITTPIIMKLLEEKPGISSMTFMVQREVAERMVAPPGGKDYGALSIAVQYYCDPKLILTVPPVSFIPPPGVDSEVIWLNVLDKPKVDVKNEKVFFGLVRSAFAQRRKTLVNAVYNSGTFKCSKEDIVEILNGLGIDEKRRGETLSILQFAQLADAIFVKNLINI